jgi:hypothetical protein
MPGRRISLSGQDVYGSDALERLTGNMPAEPSPAGSSLRFRKRKATEMFEKVTFYLTRNQLLALEQECVRLYSQSEGGKRVDRSEIVRRLIDTYLCQSRDGACP